MIAAALSTAAETAWWITLGFGLVVALVVWGLLEQLRQAVLRIDRAVSELWTMGKRVAGNTATTYMLVGTRDLGVELAEEVERHRALAEGSDG